MVGKNIDIYGREASDDISDRPGTTFLTRDTYTSRQSVEIL